jgi:hypothetical protein
MSSQAARPAAREGKTIMSSQSSRPKAGSVFLLAVHGAEILYLPGTNEIVSRLESASPAASAGADEAAQKKSDSSKRRP